MSKVIILILLISQMSYAGNAGSTAGGIAKGAGRGFIDDAVKTANRHACQTTQLSLGGSAFTGEVVKEAASFAHPTLRGVDLKALHAKHKKFVIAEGIRQEKLDQLDLLLASINKEDEGPICVDETDSRESAKTRCFTLCGVSSTLAYVGGALCGHWYGGLAGLVPAPFAVNACRIYEERELQLENCEKHHLNLKKQKLNENQRKLDRLEEINQEFDAREEALIEESREAVRQLTIDYSKRGANFRDPEVQAEIRREAKVIEDKLQDDLRKLNQERADAIAAI